MSATATVIGTIHALGVPSHIAAVGGSVEPVVSTSTSQEAKSNIFMVVENDDKIVEVGTAQGFTKIMEPKKEKVDPPLSPPHASRGQGMGGGASQGGPPRGGGREPVVIPPTMEDLGASDDDDGFLRDPCNGGEDDIIFDDPIEGEGEDDKDNGEEDDEDEIQVVTQSGRSTSDGLVPFNPKIHDVTGYEKADIIRLRNTAFKGDVKYAKKVKGALLGIPTGSIPTLQQINSSELFALHAPQKGKSENDDDDEEGPPKEANIHQLWLPFFQGNKALGDCPPAQFEPPGDWPKVYTPQDLQNYFPMGVTTWKSHEPLPSLIIVVPPNSPQLEKGHFLDHLHSHAALQRYLLGVGKLRKQFAFCPYCGIRSENQVSAYSHAR